MNEITVLLQIIAGAIILNTPLIIMWLFIARAERKATN